jgi:hypothetical protein
LNNYLASLNTSSLSKGMYLVRIQSDKGVISTRFMKD